jgi:PAS domain S-box-containing protein
MLAALTETLGSHDPVLWLVERLPIGVLLVDVDHEIGYANPAACEVLDGTPEGLRGRHLSEILGPNYKKALSDPDSLAHPLLPRSANASQPPADKMADLFEHNAFEIQIKTLAGMERIVELLDGGRSGRYSVWYLNDVTARKQLEVELHHRDAFFHNLIDSSVDGIIAADMKGRIILFNSGAQKILGYTREEAFSRLHTTRLYPEGEAREILKRMRSEKYGGRGKLLRHELIAITRDGRHIPMSLSGGIIYDGDREIATYGIFTDLRAMRKVEADLEQTHELLLQSEKMAGLGRLAAGVAHEINNPMSGIMLYANLVKEQLGADHPAAQDMEIIVHEAERCKQIVSDLLEFSAQTSYEHTGVDLGEQIRKALGLFTKQPLFHNIVISVEIAPDLARIWGNPIRLNQVFTNLIVNAAQAMEGKGRLEIIARPRANRSIVEVVFRDTGPGIDPQFLGQIFDPFFTTKADSGGTGLGLSVSYAIIREHKGTIRVESELGKGTVFTLRFPILQSELMECKP